MKESHTVILHVTVLYSVLEDLVMEEQSLTSTKNKPVYGTDVDITYPLCLYNTTLGSMLILYKSLIDYVC